MSASRDSQQDRQVFGPHSSYVVKSENSFSREAIPGRNRLGLKKVGLSPMRHAKSKRVTPVLLVISLCIGGFAFGAAGANSLWRGEAGKGVLGEIINGSFGVEVVGGSLVVPADAGGAEKQVTFQADLTMSGSALRAKLRLGPGASFDPALAVDAWGYNCGGSVAETELEFDGTSEELLPEEANTTRRCTITIDTNWVPTTNKYLDLIESDGSVTNTWPFELTLEQVR